MAAETPRPDDDLGARLERLESAVARLVAAHETDRPEAEDAADAASAIRGASATDADDRLRDATPDPARFWALEGLVEHSGPDGGVVFAGAVDLPVGPVRYQWGRPAQAILRADWADRADRAAALGHPLRLAILRLLLEGEHTVAQLVDTLQLASTGVAYHHLNQLQGAGWVTSPSRGSWAIPASRIVPLLTIVIALEES